MKKILILALTLVLASSLVSCTDMLENPRKGALDFSTYYANATGDDAEKLIARAYNLYFGGPESSQVLNFFEIISDDISCGGGTYADNANRYRDADELTSQVSDWVFNNRSTLYGNSYSCIYQCNLIIEKIPESSDAKINKVKAEAKFLRAVCMFELMRTWHNPPFADHIFTSDDMYAPNGDPKVMIDWVLENLAEAAQGLPSLAVKGGQIAIGGRATVAAAQAFAGKAALWYGTQYNDKEYVEKAIEPLKSIINSGKYGLIANPADLLRVKSDWCEEYIFEQNCAESSSNKTIQNDNRHTWRSLRADNINVPSSIHGYGWGFCNPTQEFVDFMKEHDGENSPRFKSKILSYEDLLAMNYNGAKGMKPGMQYPNCVGYFNATSLMWEEDLYTETGNNFWSRANNPIIRYAEVLLMYAEAQFLANNDSDGSGLNALNEVRNRAGLEPLNALTLQSVQDERRAELFGETERWFDIIRWKVADDVLKDAGKQRYAFKGYKPGTTEYNIEVTNGQGNGWNDKYWELPFGSIHLQANPSIEQHQGW